MVGSYEHCDGSPASKKGGEFLHYLTDCQLLKKDLAVWSELCNLLLII
jgi:hypothetical protein